MFFARLPLRSFSPPRLRFGLRTLLLLVLLAGLGLAAYFNAYRHYRAIYENEETVLSFLTSGAVSDYREEPSFNCLCHVYYRRQAHEYATRHESVPWYLDHAWSPVDRTWFLRTRCLVLPLSCAQWPPHVVQAQAIWDEETEWHRFYQHVARLPELEYFKPAETFSDDDLALFKNHPKLRFLDLRETRVTVEALETLNRDFPGLAYLAVNEPTDMQLQYYHDDVRGLTAEDLRRFQPTPEYWAEIERRRAIARRQWLRSYEEVFARLSARSGLSLAVGRRPPPFNGKNWDLHPAINRFPHGDWMPLPAADLATLAKVRAEQPEAVFYDFRPQTSSEYPPKP